MKLHYIILSALITSGISSCKKELISDPGQYTKIYMPQAVDYPAERSLIMADTLQSVIFGAACGGADDQSQMIDVSFRADPALVESFNMKNGTTYEIMPEGSYELEKTETIIPAGQFNTEALSVKVKTVGGIEPLKQYLLPVSIEQVSPGLPVNEKLRTTYFLIQGTYQDFDRSEWQVLNVSSQEPPNIGSNILDDDTGTSWHTKWKGGAPPHPHYITVDMAETKNIHGFYFWPHNTANGNPKDIHIDLSTDGNNWQSAGDFVLTNEFVKQQIYLDAAKQARYFKITINSSTGNTLFTHPTEIGAF